MGTIAGTRVLCTQYPARVATPKSGSILRLCHRRYHHGYALAECVERGVVGDRGWGKIEGVGL